MTQSSPNPIQKLVRGWVRDWINQANTQQTFKPTKPKTHRSVSRQKTSNQPKRARSISLSDRVSVLTRDKYRCVFCGRTSQQVQLEVDHIIPFCRGGSNDLSNLQTLCFDCNRGKGSRQLS